MTNNIIKRILYYLMNRGFFKHIPDDKYLKLKYWILMNKKLDLKNPRTFNEKLQWLKLYDRKDIYTTMVDKYEAKKYVSKIIGKEYIIPTLGIYNTYDEIRFDKLPMQFVIKCTHDSGKIIICHDKNNLNYEQLRKNINLMLKRDYYYIHREWPYKNVKPRIIIEPLMKDSKCDYLKDYKFQMFNGKLCYSFVCTDRATNVKFTFFDENKKFIDVCQDHAKNDPCNAQLPFNYEKMVELAEKLSKNIPEVRVDFYEIDNKIYFGELTFFDSAGFGPFEPEKYDYIFGEKLDLSMVKKNEK